MTGISVLFAFYHGIFPSESDTDFVCCMVILE